MSSQVDEEFPSFQLRGRRKWNPEYTWTPFFCPLERRWFHNGSMAEDMWREWRQTRLPNLWVSEGSVSFYGLFRGLELIWEEE